MRTFRGGVHPRENKAGTEHRSVERLPTPPRVVIPLQQHTGAPCEPMVAVGEVVHAGQKIGQASAPVSAPVHASISGKVVAIEPRPHPALPRPVAAVVIEADGTDAQVPEAPATTDWRELEAAAILSLIREAGVVGLGGAAFPTHVKLTPPRGATVDTLIINGAECEPYLTSDHRLMLERPEDVLEGIRILRRVLGVDKVVLAIERNKPDAIALMSARCRDGGDPVEVVGLPVKYPQGAEKQLIGTLLGREVPSGGLPFQVGVVVQNVGTAAAVADAVVRSRPVTERVVTVAGDGILKPRNLLVPIGTLFSHLIEACGGYAVDGPVKLLMGGPMMGLAQYTPEVPVVKGTSGVLVLRHDARQARQTACVRCGRCVEICPMGLVPHRIADYADRDRFDLAAEYGVRDCIECGSCVYVCGSRRPLLHLIKYAKLNLSRKKA